MDISIYKLSDVGISSNLIGSPSLTNGQCPSPGRWIMKQSPAGVNSRFAEVTENDILRMQYIVIPNDTRKATKLGMKVLRDKQCFNTQFGYMSSVFSPDRQASLMPLEQRPCIPRKTETSCIPRKMLMCPYDKSAIIIKTCFFNFTKNLRSRL